MQTLSAEQRLILDTVRDIARERVRPRAAEIDERDEFPHDILALFAEQGILAPLVPEEYGGIGMEFNVFARVIGQYLTDKPRAILRRLAKSKNLWERRTALYACLWFIMKQKSVDDAEAVCELLINEKEEIIQKAVGTMVRCIGIDRPRLHAFLDKHAAVMPRVALRYAVEKLSPADKTKYMAMGR